MKARRIAAVFAAIFLLGPGILAQNSIPRTLLPAKITDEFIGEASGERAMNHIIEMAAYIHDRPASEYSGYFFETQYILDRLKEYNLEGAIVNKYPGSKTWDGVKATLWEVSPGKSKIADYSDLPAVLASGSTNTDVTAELVWVGEGGQNDIEKAGVEGKIAVTSGSISMVHSLAVAKGALVLFRMIHQGHCRFPLQFQFPGSWEEVEVKAMQNSASFCLRGKVSCYATG
jgi:hypothetical protein